MIVPLDLRFKSDVELDGLHAATEDCIEETLAALRHCDYGELAAFLHETRADLKAIELEQQRRKLSHQWLEAHGIV